MNHKLQQKITLFVTVVSLSMIMAGCGNSDASGRADPVMAQAEVSRDRSPQVEPATVAELVAGNNDFAFALYQAIRGPDGNLFYSPYSISAALAMTYAGARENTARQMAETLHYDTVSPPELHAAFNALDLDLTQADSTGDGAENFKLVVANSLWGQVDYPFRAEFLALLAENYGAGVRQVDFIDQQKREQARTAINDWVAEATADKIKDLIGRNHLSEDTRLVLANAIYFKADWEHPFLSGTKEAEFRLLNGQSVTVPLMSQRADRLYAEGEQYQLLEIPYKGGRMAMMVLLPAEGQFEAIEGQLDNQFLAQALDRLTMADTRLYLPKFQYQAELELAETLATLGMPDAFAAGQADFSGMDGRKDLFIAHAVHKSFIAVDEMGTEAAAATGVVAEVESMPIMVRVDRPFLFFIRDLESGSVLFVGRVVNPVE